MSRNNLEDIYPLAPLQQGILYQSLVASEASEPGAYFVQAGWTLRGDVDTKALARAFQEVTDRHGALRTAFVWEKLEQPMQVVWKRVKVPVTEVDLRGLPADEQAARVAAFAEEDRRRGFDLTRAPLLRLAFLRLEDDAYRFIWSSHHLILDGWSNPILLFEVFGLYNAKINGREHQLERARSYRDYVSWLQKQDASKAEAFWRARLAGLTAPTPIPVGSVAAPAHGSPHFGERKREIQGAPLAAIQDLVRRHNLTLSTLLQGAWALLLARYSGEDDVLFGATVSGRSAPVPGIDRMVGLFINTVPVRVRVPRDETVLAWLTALHQAQGELTEFEYSPLVDVHGWSAIPRGTPLFESLVVFENYPIDPATAPQQAGEKGPSGPRKRTAITEGATVETPPYPLTLLGALRQTLTLQIGHDARRVDAATVDRVLAHLATILEAFARDPAAKLGDVSLLDEAERRTLLVEWNDTAAPIPEGVGLHQLFEQQVDRTPDAVALVAGTETVTYRRLDAWSNAIAHRLAACGVGPGVLVGVSVHRSAALVAAMLGILKAGGAYVPLDPAYPRPRLAQILLQAQAPVIVIDEAARAALPENAAELVLVDEAPQGAVARPIGGASARDLAYVLFTSGSTGTPKGVAIEHRAAVALVAWGREVFSAAELAGVLFSTSISFDLSVFEVFLTLAVGGELIIAANALELPALPAAAQVTLINTVPSAMAELLSMKAVPASARTVCLAGEALPASLATAVYAEPTIEKLYNLYGPTEDTTYSTYTLVPRDGRAPLIGRPIANGTAYILDARMEPAPIGVAGEIYLGGAGLARGYLHQPQMTADRFVASPFVAGERLYRTSDLGRYRENGDLEYLGRLDHQIKLRGFRIELGEIEAVLRKQPGVRDVVVVAREDQPGDKRLVAYLVGGEGAALVTSELRAAVKDALPEYMVPAIFTTLDALPLTANGKVDRRALPAPDGADASSEREYVAPRGPVEETLAAIFAEILRAPSVGAHDGFFELGGHSLLATQAITRIRGAFGVDLPLRTLFDAPSPAQLAARITGSLRGSALPALVAVPRDRKLRLSFAQERLWLVDQIDPGNPAYNVSEPLRLLGPLDVEAYERALREVVRRHEVLRTTIATVEGRPVQIIHAEVPFWGGLVDLSSLPQAEREPAARAQAAEDARLPFDLARGPLLRARLIRLDAEEHLLLLTMHHIVSDAWTRGIMSREIRALYEAFRAGQASPLPELAVQYADFAEWQRGWLSGDVLAEQLDYWKTKLAGAPLALELPTDRPRPPVQTFRGALRGMALSAEATKALQDLSRKEGVTLYMTLLTALDLLLYRYTGQPDVVVGTSIAGRTQTETEKLVGFFINALVLRTVVDDDETLRATLQQVRETCLGAYAHQDMPFERLVHELAPEPDRSRAPLFQVIFTMQNAPRAGLALPGLSIRSLGGSGSTTAKYDLTFLMGEIDGSLRCSIEFNTDLFDASTIDRMLRQLSALLVAMPKSLEKKVREISLLPEEERARLLVGWNPVQSPLGEGACLHDLFEAQVDRTPDATALVAGAARLTFAELDRRANQLAHHLHDLGVGPDSVVGLCLGRGAEVIVGLLGILKSGGAYVPLEPAYPAGRIAQILGEAGAKIVVTQASLAASMPAGTATILVDSDAAQLAALPTDRLENEATSSNLAYVLFTSGSTGKPKGVAVEHRQLVNYTLGVSARLGLAAGASYAHVSTFAADLGNTVLFPPLVTGGVLHVISEELTTDPDGLGAYFAREHIDCLKIVPSHLSALLSAGQPARVLPRALLVLGGEASSWELVDRLERLAPAMRILNHYGPTETTVGVLTYAVEKGARPSSAIVPLGTPLPNNRVHVLDGRMEPTPTGVPGEVYIGGAQIARGYLDQPELTAERFVPDPFTPGARLYKTGDRARYLPDGALVFLGRIDFQVKIRGFRIELGEIESALAAHPALKEAVVLALDEGDTKVLAAFVVKQSGVDAPAAADLAAFLAQRLPDYMVPASFAILDALPLSSNGKIDRRALATVERPKEDAAGYVAPRTPTEDVLASIWADVFTRERIGIDERFADLGGHSLLAIQIVARARDAFQAQIPLRAIFEHPTIATLAAVVDATVREDAGLEAPPITRMPRGAELRLSFAQERLWFLDQLEPGSSFYNVPSATRVRGAFSVEAMMRAFQEVVRRHEVLRTTFALQEGQPIQVIHDEVAAAMTLVDLGALDPAAREEAARSGMRDEAAQPFDLATGPMVRGKILRLGEDDHVLLLTMHHIVSDASTRGILQRELMALYSAFTRGRPSPLAELPVQYADYAHWQRKWLDGEALEKQLAYWKGHLDGAPTALVMPTDRAHPPVQTHRGDRRSMTLPASLLGAMKELSRREGMTLFMTLLAATYALLHRYSGQDDILVGTPILNRSRPEIEGLIGFFVNTLVLRARPAGGLPFRELLQQVREACLGGYAHQDIPFERLVQELAPDRDLSRSPLFQVMFTLETVSGEGGSAGAGLEMRGMSAPTTTAKFDLMIGMVEAPRGLGVNVEYNVDLFDGATIERMLRHLRRLIEGFAADPEQTIDGASLLSDEERRQILVEWNDTRSEYPRDASLQALFEAQATARPEAIALTFGAEHLTYGDLDRRGNQLAHHLAARGVGHETPVGVLAVRSIEMIVAVLGILKAGGAYVPLDPEYPAPRLAFMIEDAGVKLIVGAGRFPAALEATALVRLDADSEAIARESEARLGDVGASGSSLAYVMYTSGSTGMPKGVCVEHRSVVRLVRSTNYGGFGADEVFLQLAPMTFDAATLELWGPLLNGGRLAIFAPGIPAPADLGDVIRRDGVTTLWLTSGLFNAVVESHVEALTTLRRVLTGGDALSVSHVESALAALPGVEIINGYGPTEGTTFTTTYAIPTQRAAALGGISIGRPIANTQVYILDAALAPTPIGVFGELYVGGDGVARGYLNRPELTAERFIASPFAANERLYKTGDLARFLPDGTIAFGGRRDFQVKIRGFRIELGEIEAALGRHPALRECTVIAREDTPGDKRLVAYLVAAPPATAPTAQEARAFLKEVLPDHLIPTAFVVLQAMPLTANGKIDRAALPVPDEGAGKSLAGTVAPRDELEAQIVNVWRRVLGVSRIGIKDSFFDLGGHSMLAVKMTAELKKTIGRTIPLMSLFEAQTIEQIADLMRDGAVKHVWKTLVPMKPTGTLRPFFLVTRPNANSLGYIALAKRLDPDQPVYGLQFQYPEESYLGRPYTREEYEERGRSYVEILRACQPEGPYLLGGMCEGALIAFVMTRQLEEAGQKVAFLGMMDAWPEENTRRRLVNFVSKYYSKVKDFMAMTPPNRERYLKQTIARIGLRLRPQRARAQVSEATNEVARRAAFEATTQQLWDERVFPGPGFVPPQVDVPITVFRVKDQPPWRIKDERLGWSDRTRGGVELHRVDGVHTDFMRPPHVTVLARELNLALRRVHAKLERDDALAAAAASPPPAKTPSR